MQSGLREGKQTYARKFTLLYGEMGYLDFGAKLVLLNMWRCLVVHRKYTPYLLVLVISTGPEVWLYCNTSVVLHPTQCKFFEALCKVR